MMLRCNNRSVDMSFTLAIGLLALAIIANFFSALAGGGAGLIQFPILLLLGLPYAVALATHKIASVALGLGATIRHLRTSKIERQFALYMVAVGVPGVLIGAWVILDVPEMIAKTVLGVLTLGLGLFSMAQPELGKVHKVQRRDVRGYAIGSLLLFVIGFLNGSFASGTGLFVTITLVLWFGLDYARATAYTLITVGLCWNGSGAIALGILGEVQWTWLPALVLGSLVGGYLGAHVSIAKGNTLIKRTFEVVTVLVGLSLLFLRNDNGVLSLHWPF